MPDLAEPDLWYHLAMIVVTSRVHLGRYPSSSACYESSTMVDGKQNGKLPQSRIILSTLLKMAFFLHVYSEANNTMIGKTH